MSCIGCIVPISLFAYIILIKIVSFLIELINWFISTIPSLFTFKYVTINPALSKDWHVCKTAGCSIFEVIICFPLKALLCAIPLIAVLSLSEPDPVK